MRFVGSKMQKIEALKNRENIDDIANFSKIKG